ncbi:uncharacterized protein F4807DRAFT_416104 [Annulohypoxylon truncatum]|uniref:uncharacterized protein n=1 Tax=Annulohypoxylon truncatum TaxID=327061 RepID=UPI00200881AE|nr:uncharacterized protein F4807DRAFT_416104 [Annulohypoxylon truncatum]KAI1212430.1 hypothetical protein F4807DRAFT_416104 [Annulohypoxylon truncatum]
MNNPKSTCLLCRHMVVTRGGARTPQWLPQISRFSTTLAPKATDLADLVAATTPVRDRLTNKNKLEEKTAFRKITLFDQSMPGKPKWTRKMQEKKLANIRKGSDRVDALFRRIVSEQTAGQEEEATARRPKNYHLKLALSEIIKQLGEVQHLLDKGEPVAKVYKHFKTVVDPVLREKELLLGERAEALPQVCQKTIMRLMVVVRDAKLEEMRSPELPRASELLLYISRFTNIRPNKFLKLAGALVKEIVKMDPSAESPDSSVVDDGLLTQEDMIADLIECWKILSVPSIARNEADDDEVLENFWFPRVDKHTLSAFSKGGSFHEAFVTSFPQYKWGKDDEPTGVLGIATYALLLDPRRANQDLRYRAARFINRVAYLISYVQYSDLMLRQHTSKYFPEIEPYVMAQWSDIKEQLRERAQNAQSSVAVTRPEWPLAPIDQDDINQRSIKYHLHLAIPARNSKEVDSRWKRFIKPGPDEKISAARAKELKNYPDVFDLFIYTQMALNQPEKAINVLITLRQVGIRPTLKTWNVMLDGCKMARNLNGINNVWKKLVASEMKLDMKLWTTRVSGLIRCGDVSGSLQALREMVWMWDQSSKDENAKAVKPTIEPINAVLSGLLRQNLVTEAEKLLEWAEEKGLEPDIFTFNPLLQRYIQDGRAADVRELLVTMEKRGVNADAATFTILIDAAFRQIPPGDAEAESRAVRSVLEGMEKAGLETNVQNYGKIIYLLLQGSNTAKDAVRHVLSHLWDQGLELTPHIYTMIVDYYFSIKPPDIKAVDSLLQRRRVFDYDDQDIVLYDNVVRGYTEAGLPERSLVYYTKLTKAGLIIPLKTQVKVLLALLQKGNTKAARYLAETASSLFETGYKNGEVEKAEFWDHTFWHIASANGLLDMSKFPGERPRGYTH